MRIVASVAIVSALAMLTGGEAGATTSVINQSLAVQVIDVCSDNTFTNCGLPGNAIPQSFISTVQNVFTQANLAVSFLPTVTRLVAPQFQTLSATDPTFSAGQCNFTNTNFPSLCALTRTPGHGQSSDPATINLYFVNQITSGAGTTFGSSWVNGNGIAISRQVFAAFNPLKNGDRLDTLAHEIAHNLGLDHTTFGNSAQPATDLETAGSFRTVPTSPSLAASQTNPTGLDQLNLSQQGQVKSTAFVSGVPLVKVAATDNAFGTELPPVHFHVTFQSGAAGVTLNQLFFNSSTAIDDFTNLQVSDVVATEFGSPVVKTIDTSGQVLEFDFSGFSLGDLLSFDLSGTPHCDCSLDAENLTGSKLGYIFSTNFRGIGNLDSAGNSDFNDLDLGGSDPFLGTTGYIDTPTDGNGRQIPQGLHAVDIDPDDSFNVAEPGSLPLLLSSLLFGAPIVRASRRARSRSSA